MVRVTVILAALAAPAAASDLCDDLWLARNATFAKHGHCFASPLARATFGAACPGAATLPPRDAATVAMARAEERRWGCAVDTSVVRPLRVDALPLRLRLEDQPIADGLESACIGWRGPAFPLRAGARPGADIVARAERGAVIGVAHASAVPGWSYYVVDLPDGREVQGWTETNAFSDADLCDVVVG
ncbi:DUF4453 domain-containing protein [Jannaschia sp. Os4]|uniref:DUF4453 domain-containing protein n=1 Tax=Jannaschia sp. Os4 TaxID=2807617 RepID=UPI00193AD55E|nr:DUF4453 domain-containing protein [Jannaschia sp. Os4]MBM2577836.1 DUF4453 domain-containing protein [Jannaschia sp. Os4]